MLTQPAKKKWSALEVEELTLGFEIGLSHEEIASILCRSVVAVGIKSSKLKLLSTYCRKKSTEEYKESLPEGLKVLEPYINTRTKILHEHSCGYRWYIKPEHVIRGVSCPICARTGFDSTKPGTVYCVYFEALGLYKVGITNNPNNRLRDFGYSVDVIFTRYFKEGKDARNLETQWLNNLSPYLYNSGELRSGNTETFNYDL